MLNTSLVRHYCVAHRSPSRDRSPVTVYRGSWAYCANGYGGTHDWLAIEACTYAHLLTFGPTFVESSSGPGRTLVAQAR